MLRPILVALALALTACGHAETAQPQEPPRHTPAAAPLVATPEVCPMPDSGFDCEFQKRIQNAKNYAETRPGIIGIVLRDRKTGAMWRNDHAGELTWTASTIKLAMIVNLLERNRSGKIKLTADDRRLMTAMLHSSDDDAADTLWKRYTGTTFNAAFPKYGMADLVAQRGYSANFPYWGFEKCTTNDLDRLINYVLDTVPAEDRAYIVEQMRQVGPEQQWGVWGPDSGAKNGWSEEDGGWVMNSVGFVGKDERYTLAIMNNLKGEGGYNEGRETDTEITRILFR
ncbi:serine hydrolase [Lentzea nigeriaca]|uniref:tat pathway signal sequence n=1 Tax=Lentzea nigeriaca TaxID=1128665 RepID=UPI001EF89277|nr:tat pathway signal sequence [Lentzea nigeriaca]MBM7860966.1 beta-lactamase class A [Lentzea nigeriaca]